MIPVIRKKDSTIIKKEILVCKFIRQSLVKLYLLFVDVSEKNKEDYVEKS